VSAGGEGGEGKERRRAERVDSIEDEKVISNIFVAVQ